MCFLYHCRPLWAFEWFILKEHIGGFCFLVENAECWRMVNFFYSQLYMKVFPSRTPSKLIWVVWDPAKDTQISRKIGVWRSTLWGRRWKYKGGSVFVFLGDCVYFIDFYFSQLVSVLRCAVCTCREEKGWETEVIIFDTRLILMKPSCVISGVLGRSSYSLVCSLRL